jgi:hypothetical protein
VGSVSEKRLLVVWLTLSAITLVSIWMGHPGNRAAVGPNGVVAAAAVAIALVKTRIVLREFMEVRHAPVLLGRLTDLWLVSTAVILLGAYWVGLALSPT